MRMRFGIVEREIAGPRGERVQAQPGNLISDTRHVRMMFTMIIVHTKIEESSHQNIHFGYFESFVFSLNHYFCWTIHLFVLKCIKWCQKHCAAAKDITFWKVWKFVGEISITLSLQNYFWWNLSICQTTRQMAKDKTR